jgi:hypothetical protein
MILLWGLPGDTPLARVHAALQRLGQDVVFVDQSAVLNTDVELCVGSTVEGRLRIKEQVIELGTVNAVYLRPYESHRLPSIQRAGKGSPAWQHANSVDELLLSWVELTPALVVNPPSAMAANGSKPYQAAWVHSCGFEIPATLITTDPDAALEFWKQYQTVIYKSVSGIRSIVSRLNNSHKERLKKVVWCPTQFQQYIPGNDYRVHVVGKEIFACKILSDADDYRYATKQGTTVKIQPCDLPEEVASRCKALAASMKLLVAGVDLRHTLDDRWYCFEVNPSPGFTYFQEATHQVIDEAIAKLLTSGEDIADTLLT